MLSIKPSHIPQLQSSSHIRVSIELNSPHQEEFTNNRGFIKQTKVQTFVQRSTTFYQLIASKQIKQNQQYLRTEFTMQNPRQKVKFRSHTQIEESIEPENIASESNKCQICFEKEPNILFEPCLHGGICQACALSMAKSGRNACFLCRENIEKMLLLNKLDSLFVSSQALVLS